MGKQTRKRASFLDFGQSCPILDGRGKLSRVVFLAILFFCCSTSAQAQLDSRYSMLDTRGSSRIDHRASSIEDGKLFSSSVSRKFYEIAYELANSEDVTGPQLEQAIIFLTAAMKLDNNVEVPVKDVRRSSQTHYLAFGGPRPLLIKLACRHPEQGPRFTGTQDYSNLVYNLLVDYVDEFADVEVAKKAVLYLLSRQNTREQREKLLEQMLGTLGRRNIVLGSELATLLGLLKAEKADLETAEFYLIQAYKSNRYNKLAFAKLAELKPERIGPAIYLERLRLALRENPADIEAALTFARQAEQLQLYQTAAAAYEYCAGLFTYLYPSQALPARIYLPWAISAYNTQRNGTPFRKKMGSFAPQAAEITERNQSKCLQIAQRVRQDGRFDLRLEAIAGKAATKIGNGELATQIFQAAEKKAQQLLIQGSKRTTTRSKSMHSSDSPQVMIEQLAWFYCFVLPVRDKALDWANRAYSTEPNSPAAAAILAYALVMNNQTEWAKPIIRNYQRNQIADLTLAQIQLAQGQKDSAIETLKTAIAKDPGSFAAERAKEILAQQGGEYTPPVDPDAVLPVLENVFGQALVPVFTRPEQIISVQFDIRRDPARREPGDEFAYGGEFSGAVAIVNNSPEPLVISDDALFMGNIRIDADISGDLNRKIPNLVSAKIRTALLIEPGRSILIPVRLITGELRKMLLTYPQASLDIEFKLYLDPVTTDEGKIANRLTYIQPTRARIKRPGIELTGKYIRSQFSLISTGHVGQKIKTAQLFIGLLTEQHAMLNRKPLYRFMYADWMEPLLRSALLHETGLLRNPADGEWVVKVHTMSEMSSLPLDYELISAVAKNLNNTNWPVRMMAIYLLAKTTDTNFDKVLDWVAKNDSSKLVRDMAIALGRSGPDQQWQGSHEARSQPWLGLTMPKETAVESNQ